MLPLLLIAILYCLYLASTVAVMIHMRAPSHAHVMTVNQELPQSDFALFWYAGKLIWVQMNLHFGHHIALAPQLKKIFTIDLLAANAPITFAWPYPPPMALLVVPFSFLPLATAFWVWRVFCLGVACIVLRKAGLGWLVICAGLASPAGLHDLLGGQNGTLTGALLVSALLLMKDNPVWAGGLAGLLSIKPQIAIGLAGVLLHRPRKTALLATVAMILIITVAATVLQGWAAWMRFLEIAQPDSVRASAIPFRQIFPAAGTTVFLLARSLNATVIQASIVQGVVSLMALFAIWLIWARAHGHAIERMALTVCLSILAAPHGFAYDLVAFSIAMAALAVSALDWEKPLFGVLWLFGGYTITFANMTGVIIMPLVAVLAAGFICARMNAGLQATGNAIAIGN